MRAVQDLLHLRKQKVITVASSAVAAALLDGGEPAHSVFKIPIPCGQDDTCNVSVESEHAKYLRETHVILWDEIVMTARYGVEAVDRMLRDITGINKPFGRKIVLLSGDFGQILPNDKRGSRC